MLSISAYKKIFGEKVDDFSDDEIREIRDLQYQFAEAAFCMWSEEIRLDENGKKIHNKDEPH